MPTWARPLLFLLLDIVVPFYEKGDKDHDRRDYQTVTAPSPPGYFIFHYRLVQSHFPRTMPCSSCSSSFRRSILMDRPIFANGISPRSIKRRHVTGWIDRYSLAFFTLIQRFCILVILFRSHVSLPILLIFPGRLNNFQDVLSANLSLYV